MPTTENKVETTDGTVADRKRLMGRYELVERIGEGSMGEVFAARDPYLDRRVAVKVIRRDLSTVRKRLVARLKREAKSLARVNHPNVTTIYDVGVDGSDVYLALEFVEGTTLTEWLQTKPPVSQVLDAFRQAAEGLSAAHREGLIHRDFKPDNVLITPRGVVKVTDFGLAIGLGETDEFDVHGSPRLVDAPKLTHSGIVIGTPAYMAPEQFDPEFVTAHVDQFAFGVALFEALAGVRPFAGNSAVEITSAAASGDYAISPRKLPRRIRDLVARMLSAEPSDRYASMAEVATALRPRGTRYRRLAALAAAATLCVSFALVSMAASDDGERASCDAGEEEFDRVWNPMRRARLIATHATDAHSTWKYAEELASAVDNYRGEWVHSYQQNCRETDGQVVLSSDAPAVAFACLWDQRESLNQWLDAQGEASIASDLASAPWKSNVAACESSKRVDAWSKTRNTRTESRQPIAALRRELAALRRKDYRDELETRRAAITEGQRLVTEAEKLRFRPLEAEARLLLGHVLNNTEHFADAHKAYMEAALAAVAGRHDFVLIDAQTGIAETATDIGATVDDLIQLEREALAALERVGGDSEREALLMSNLGNAFLHLGALDAARAHLERAAATYDSIKDPNAYMAAWAHLRLSAFYSSAGDSLRALASAKAAHAMHLRKSESNDSIEGYFLLTLTEPLIELDRYAEAQPILEKLITQQRSGPTDVWLLSGALAQLAQILRTSDPKRAIVLAKESVTAIAGHETASERDTLITRTYLAATLIASGQRVRGEAMFRKIIKSAGKLEARLAVDLSLNLGGALLRNGDFRVARTLLRRARDYYRRNDADVEAALTSVDLAEAEVALNNPRVARQLASSALASLDANATTSLARSHWVLARCELRFDNRFEAESSALEARELFASAYGERHKTVRDIDTFLSNLAVDGRVARIRR